MKNTFSRLAAVGRKARVSAVAIALGSASVASHAAVDVTAVVTEINSATAPIGAIGAAVLVVLVTAAVYKWVRRAL